MTPIQTAKDFFGHSLLFKVFGIFFATCMSCSEKLSAPYLSLVDFPPIKWITWVSKSPSFIGSEGLNLGEAC